MGARIFDAKTLERWNVVNRVVPDETLFEKARRQAQSLADGPTRAHAVTKLLLEKHANEGSGVAQAALCDLAPALFETEDMRTGIESLLASGPGNARFQGR